MSQEIKEMVDMLLERKRRELAEATGDEQWQAATGAAPGKIPPLALGAKLRGMSGLQGLGVAAGLTAGGMALKHMIGRGKRKQLKQQRDWWKGHAQAASHQNQLQQSHIAGLQHHIAGMRGNEPPHSQYSPVGMPMYSPGPTHGPPMASHNVYHPQHAGMMYPRPSYGY